MDIKDKIKDLFDQLMKLASVSQRSEMSISEECIHCFDLNEPDRNKECEEINIDEVEDEYFSKAIENALNEINALEATEEFEMGCKCCNHTVFVRGIKKYVLEHLNLPLTDGEFNDIETGFRIRWNYSTGQMVSDKEFEKAVDQYLASIESSIDRNKMKRVVGLILEYMEQMEDLDGDK